MKKTVLLFLCILFLTSCAERTEKLQSDKLTIAVSIPPEAAFAEAVCSDTADIITVIPSGYSPETYEPTPQDIERLMKADVYFTIGVPAEQSNILPNLESVETVDLAKLCAEKYPELNIGSERDPHIWLSARRAELMVEAIADKLSELCPENSDRYGEACETYVEKIKEASENATNILSQSGQKGFVVFHPAFGYFADEYGLKMTALEEEGKEATAAHLAEAADMAKAEGIKAIFYQQETDGRQARAFAEEIGGEAVMLSPLSENYIENLSAMAEAIAKAR